MLFLIHRICDQYSPSLAASLVIQILQLWKASVWYLLFAGKVNKNMFWAPLWRFADTRLPGFLLRNSTFQAAALFLWCLLPKNWSTNDAVWMKVLICWWDVMTAGIRRWWSVLYEIMIPRFFCKERGKPKMSVGLAGIPVEIWVEFCLLIWNQWLSQRP